MFKLDMPKLDKQLDLSKLDPTRIDLTRFDVRTMHLPDVDLPKFDLPKFDLPKFDLPRFDLPRFDRADLPVDVDRVAGFARDAAYAGVGAVVVTVQKADARRRELSERISSRVRRLTGPAA